MLADAPDGLSVSEIARRLGVARSIVYRLVATLEQHGLARRDNDARFRLGIGLLALSRQVVPALRAAGGPLIEGLAEESSATAFLAIPDDGEVVAVAVARPRGVLVQAALAVGQPAPVDAGALRPDTKTPGRRFAGQRMSPPAVAMPVPGQPSVVAVVTAVQGSPGIEAVIGILALAEGEVDAHMGNVSRAAVRLRAALAD